MSHSGQETAGKVLETSVELPNFQTISDSPAAESPAAVPQLLESPMALPAASPGSDTGSPNLLNGEFYGSATPQSFLPTSKKPRTQLRNPVKELTTGMLMQNSPSLAALESILNEKTGLNAASQHRNSQPLMGSRLNNTYNRNPSVNSPLAATPPPPYTSPGGRQGRTPLLTQPLVTARNAATPRALGSTPSLGLGLVVEQQKKRQQIQRSSPLVSLQASLLGVPLVLPLSSSLIPVLVPPAAPVKSTHNQTGLKQDIPELQKKRSTGFKNLFKHNKSASTFEAYTPAPHRSPVTHNRTMSSPTFPSPVQSETRSEAGSGRLFLYQLPGDVRGTRSFQQPTPPTSKRGLFSIFSRKKKPESGLSSSTSVPMVASPYGTASHAASTSSIFNPFKRKASRPDLQSAGAALPLSQSTPVISLAPVATFDDITTLSDSDGESDAAVKYGSYGRNDEELRLVDNVAVAVSVAMVSSSKAPSPLIRQVSKREPGVKNSSSAGSRWSFVTTPDGTFKSILESEGPALPSPNLDVKQFSEAKMEEDEEEEEEDTVSFTEGDEVAFAPGLKRDESMNYITLGVSPEPAKPVEGFATAGNYLATPEFPEAKTMSWGFSWPPALDELSSPQASDSTSTDEAMPFVEDSILSHGGETLFPKSLDQREVQTIVTLERSLSTRSVRSSTLKKQDSIKRNAHELGMTVVLYDRTPELPANEVFRRIPLKSTGYSPVSPASILKSPALRGAFSGDSPDSTRSGMSGMLEFADFVDFGGEMDELTNGFSHQDLNAPWSPSQLLGLGRSEVAEPLAVPRFKLHTPRRNSEEISEKSFGETLSAHSSRGSEERHSSGSEHSLSHDHSLGNDRHLYSHSDEHSSSDRSPQRLHSPSSDSDIDYTSEGEEISSLDASVTESPRPHASAFLPQGHDAGYDPRRMSMSFKGLKSAAFDNNFADIHNGQLRESGSHQSFTLPPLESFNSIPSGLSHGMSPMASDPKRSLAAARAGGARPKPKMNVKFSSRIILYETYHGDEYDRHPEIATCNQLTPKLAQLIKNELNAVKAEMPVHETSRCYTHFF
ncbi:hypothetical protein BABINDRAFT_162154 [Babjeviella inositovora NRRL Y-12698]|uniref:Uncharacterized protein n=1 Tax=Babjeviella inositovora NRRL Y-12698 TaxID=984486 RepID=A0A1E3QNR7_9ASCO|nr:uncharacterized protein BABINDRAFT_162154 [Babjeviella inositovora NRRL Y-12698]ODQ79084.1 hypothetical protein BABINDRAFT_162154 [Babjeviella inositovora NRRL Y-12698]